MTKRKSIGKRLRFAVLHRDGFKCRYCGAGGQDRPLHIDHIKAVANGGTNDFYNLVTACADCNLGKATSAIHNWPAEAGPVKCPFAEGWPYEIEDPVYFANGFWVVTGYGLECLKTYYPIEAGRLGEGRAGLSEWLLHMAEKEWCAQDIDEFIEAFEKAIFIHRIKTDFDLEKSVHAALREADETNDWWLRKGRIGDAA